MCRCRLFVLFSFVVVDVVVDAAVADADAGSLDGLLVYGIGLFS